MNKLTLRTRITLLTGLVIITIACLLTVASIQGANHYFSGTEMNKLIVNEGENGVHVDAENELHNIDVTIEVVDAQKQFATQSLVLMGVIIIIGIGFTYLMIGRALRPLTLLSETVQDVHSRNLSTKIHIPDAKDEVGSLARSFTQMLRRLDDSFKKQKQFAESVAHELKTPLTTMKTSTQVLQLDAEPTIEEYKMHTAVVAESTDRLIHVVDGLLALAFEEYTALTDVCSSSALYEEIVSTLTSLQAENDVRIVIQGESIELKCNQRLLYQAVYNVVENAVKYNQKGGTVTLCAKEVQEIVVLTIHDTGIGIEAHEIEALFDPFYRSPSLQASKVGSGLGLPLVKQIIEKHGGEITVESERGIGTMFMITLPMMIERKSTL